MEELALDALNIATLQEAMEVVKRPPRPGEVVTPVEQAASNVIVELITFALELDGQDGPLLRARLIDAMEKGLGVKL
jgi:hypothetical protein